MSKWISRDTATGVVMVKRKQLHHTNCLRCGSENKDLIYVLACLAQDTNKLRNDLLIEVRMWMSTKKDTPRYNIFYNFGIEEMAKR